MFQANGVKFAWKILIYITLESLQQIKKLMEKLALKM